MCTCVLCSGMNFMTRPQLMVSNIKICTKIAIDLCEFNGSDCFSALKMYNISCCTMEDPTHFYVRSEEE